LGAGWHGVDDHGVVSVDPKDADLQQVAIMGGVDAHREVIIEAPLGNGVAGGVDHVLVSDAVLVDARCSLGSILDAPRAKWLDTLVHDGIRRA
jgi:hypothetical protein